MTRGGLFFLLREDLMQVKKTLEPLPYPYTAEPWPV
jgi:hypothetical protein